MTNQNLRDQAFLFLFEHFCSVFSFLEPYILEFEDSEERLLFTMKNLSDEEGQRLIEMISRNRSSEEPIGLETALRPVSYTHLTLPTSG